jgi:histidinol phosphatase-like enzyme
MITPRPAVFLDRDGTLNVERSFLTKPEEMQLLPGVADALQLLK